MTHASEHENSMRLFLIACGTFASNVVERFHEYADARLTEELTVVEQRRRLLASRNVQPQRPHRPRLAPRTAHGE